MKPPIELFSRARVMELAQEAEATASASRSHLCESISAAILQAIREYATAQGKTASTKRKIYSGGLRLRGKV